jgi:hypothetical protein
MGNECERSGGGLWIYMGRDLRSILYLEGTLFFGSFT